MGDRCGLAPPLRDGQETPPVGYCARCGGERYREETGLRQETLLCGACLRLKEKEEDEQLL